MRSEIERPCVSKCIVWASAAVAPQISPSLARSLAHSLTRSLCPLALHRSHLPPRSLSRLRNEVLSYLLPRLKPGSRHVAAVCVRPHSRNRGVRLWREALNAYSLPSPTGNRLSKAGRSGKSNVLLHCRFNFECKSILLFLLSQSARNNQCG